MMEDAGQTIILRGDVIEVVDELSCKSHNEEDRRIFAHLAYCLKPLKRPEPLSMPQIQILRYLPLSLILIPGRKMQEIWIQMNDRYMPLHDLLFTFN